MQIKDIAQQYFDRIGDIIVDKTLIIIRTKSEQSKQYANWIQKWSSYCTINSSQFVVDSKEEAEHYIKKFNIDDDIGGIIVCYPISRAHDNYLQQLVIPQKDVEGLHPQWSQLLYQNIRIHNGKKCILPCTALAVLKIIEEHRQINGLTISIFNRSDIFGKPLASMLAHDGAKVYSFDINDIQLLIDNDIITIKETRSTILPISDIIITGVPDPKFPIILKKELKDGVLCINIAHIPNFEENIDVVDKIGAMTIAMLLRNMVRLCQT